MVISKQYLKGLPIDAACNNASHQVMVHLINDFFRECDCAVGIEQGIWIARDATVTGTGGEPAHDFLNFSGRKIFWEFNFQR